MRESRERSACLVEFAVQIREGSSCLLLLRRHESTERLALLAALLKAALHHGQDAAVAVRLHRHRNAQRRARGLRGDLHPAVDVEEGAVLVIRLLELEQDRLLGLCLAATLDQSPRLEGSGKVQGRFREGTGDAAVRVHTVSWQPARIAPGKREA
jgi:hypothetical protein